MKSTKQDKFLTWTATSYILSPIRKQIPTYVIAVGSLITEPCYIPSDIVQQVTKRERNE